MQEQRAAVCYRCASGVHADGRGVVPQHQSRSTSNHHSGGVAVVLKRTPIRPIWVASASAC